MSDASSTQAIGTAVIHSERLLRLVTFPILVEGKGNEARSQDNWDLVSPAMLFSASSCLLSIHVLANATAQRREQDAWVLLRRLYEHVVDFSWIAINPETHAKQWVAEDYFYRLKSDVDLEKLGEASLSEEQRTEYQEYIDAHKKMPSVLDRTVAADAYWSTKIDGHGVFPSSPATSTNGSWSLRALYTLIYRQASAAAHPTPMSIYTYVNPGGASDRFAIGVDPTDHSDRFAYTLAPLVFASMLFVSEHVLGKPKAVDIKTAFEP